MSQPLEMPNLLLGARFHTKDSWQDLVAYGVANQRRVFH